MIKLKTTFRNSIRCEVDPEVVVLKHELKILQDHAVRELLKIQYDKDSELTYFGTTKQTVSRKISQGLSEKEIVFILSNVAKSILDIKKMGLDSKRIVLNPEWMYLDEEKGSVYLVYLPLNGTGLSFDFALFAFEIVYNSTLSFDCRRKLNQWLDDVKEKGLNESKYLQLSQLAIDDKDTALWNENSSKIELDEDGEALTGLDDYLNDSLLEIGDEPRTGYEDEEADTTDDGDCFDKNDGTFLHESTSERAALLPVPYIYRKSTGEKVFIDKNEFRIGRSTSRTHFCITNNNSVSNVHAIIFTINGYDYFIKDNNSTNGTSVNGIKLTPGGNPEKLYDESVIVLFNEELEFHF